MSDVATALLQLIGRSEPAADPALAAVKLARASLDALILRLGQSIDAKVTAQLASGLTQLSAGGETFVLKLETPLPVNTAVTLQITPRPTGQPAVTVTVQPQPVVAQPAPPAPQTLPPLPQPATAATTVPAPPAQVAAASPAPVAPPPLGVPVVTPAASLIAAVPPAPAGSLPVQVLPPGLPAQASAIPIPPAPAQPSGAPVPPPQVTVQLAPVAPAPAPATQAQAPAPAAQALAQPATIQPASPPPVSAQPVPVATTAQPATLATVSTPPTPVAAPAQPATSQLPPAMPAVPASSAPTTSNPIPPLVQPPVATAAPSVVPVASTGPAPVVAPQLSSTPALSTPAPPAAAPKVSLPLPAVVAAASSPRPVPLPASPPLAQILADPVQAAARQDSVLPLIARLATLTAPTAAVLPRPALEAIAMLLGTRLDLNRAPPDGKMLRDAVLRTGIVTEPGTRTPTDAKSALLQLRSAISGFLGGEVEAVAPVTRRPPPPLKGEPVRAPSAQPAPPLAEEPVETARQLLGHADAALSRAKLLQLASNPVDAARPNIAAPAAEFRVEVPMQLGAETGILQLLVERDGKHRRTPAERGWRMRFALNFAATGEVGAEVALLGRSANVSLWAADPSTADALEAMLPGLAPALARHGLDLGSVRVRRGVPQPATRAPGQLLDSAR